VDSSWFFFFFFFFFWEVERFWLGFWFYPNVI
jgi:hypothetical protein